MRSPSAWLRQCEAQKLANDTARLESRANWRALTCVECGDDFDGECDEGEHPVCPVCKSCDPTDDGDFAYDQQKDREALRNG